MSLIVFLILAGLGVLALAAVLMWPLRQGGGAQARLRRTHQAALKQLDRALRAGAIDETLHATQRQQLETRLAEAIAAASGGALSASSPQRATALAVALAIPVIVVGAYLYVGNPGALARSPGAAGGVPSVPQMVDGLAQRLQSNPDDLQGWILLGRSYLVLGRYADAAQAYAQANRLDANDPQVLVDYAQALVLTDPSALSGSAEPLIETALNAAPANPQALWLGGLLAQAQRNEALAARRWNALLAQSGIPDDLRQAVEQRLHALGSEVTPAAAAGFTASSPSPVPARQDDAATDGVEVKVSLSRALAARVPADATLFIFARSAGQISGPPLAVRRLSASALPADIRLTAADAMIAGSSLQSSTPLSVTARLTLHGGVTAQPGDLQGRADYAGDGRSVSVRIDQVVR